MSYVNEHNHTFFHVCVRLTGCFIKEKKAAPVTSTPHPWTHARKHVWGIRTHKRAPDDNVLSPWTFADGRARSAFVGASSMDEWPCVCRDKMITLGTANTRLDNRRCAYEEGITHKYAQRSALMLHVVRKERIRLMPRVQKFIVFHFLTT